MKNIRYLALVILVLPVMALACQCKELDIAKNYKKASMVVYANVQDFVASPSGEGGTAIILVKRWWKSSSPKRVAVNSLTNCNYNFEIGSRYLLFLGVESNGLYYSGKCSGNKKLTSTDEYAETLEKLRDDAGANTDK